MERSTSTSHQAREGIRLGELVPSDSLPHLLDLAAGIPAFAPLLKSIIRVGVVLDAEIVQKELRWRLGPRKKQEVRTCLHEATVSGVIVPFAPRSLDGEIEEHVADIAKAT